MHCCDCEIIQECMSKSKECIIEKLCEYCHEFESDTPGKSIISAEDLGNGYAKLLGFAHVSSYGKCIDVFDTKHMKTMSFEVNYCPKCGRKLGD